MRTRFLPSLLLLSLIFASYVPKAFAQGAIEISPLILELEVERGTSYAKEVIVRNSNAVPYEISFESLDVEIDPQSHNVKFLSSESKNNQKKSLASWIVPGAPAPFQLGPGEERAFRFRLDLPAGIVAGDYYGSLNFYYKPLAQEQNGNVKVRQSLGCLMLVSLNGDAGAAVSSAPYDITRFFMRKNAQETEVSVDFMNNTLRFVQVKPLITLQTTAGEIYFQKEGRSKRIFPGEKSTIPHSFPNVYLDAEEPLEMHYSLWDKQGGTKHYEETVSLESLRTAPSGSFSGWRGLLVGSGGLVFCAMLVLYFVRRKGSRLTPKSKRARKIPF